eukprot:735716-Rhodomonas_salina.1
MRKSFALCGPWKMRCPFRTDGSAVHGATMDCWMVRMGVLAWMCETQSEEPRPPPAMRCTAADCV